MPSTVKRPGFLGAFFRPEGAPPYGVFSVYSKQEAPEPYPHETRSLFGNKGYCDSVSANHLSISTGYLVDPKKLAHIRQLGVRWARVEFSPFFLDLSHLHPGSYQFGQLDSAQCALVRSNIEPLISLEAGPVQYNLNPDGYAPTTRPAYDNADDFGHYCGIIAEHELHTFASVSRFSLPENEVNSNGQMFPEGDPEIAAYSRSCYSAIKKVLPNATIYGFELNMDKNAEPADFVRRLAALDCKRGTCYDALSVHISLKYPIPDEAAPCYPQSGGTYGMQCIEDVRTAAASPIHILIGETGYFVPGNVRDESSKADATDQEFRTFAAQSYIDGASYANVDECDLYPSGYFFDGCLVDSVNGNLPAFLSLQKLAESAYR